MNWLDIQVMLIACITACACVIPGMFLVLRGIALISDAISHAVLLGIVVLFLCTHNMHSPLLMIGATAAGVLTVVLTEMLIQTHRIKKDAAIGLVYPLFFSIGVILINCYARNAHLDLDMIFLGDLAFAPFNRCMIAGYDCGPWALWTMAIILSINIIFVALFYKEIMLSIFDQAFAAVNNLFPVAFFYGLITITSITTVGAFDVVGAIVVIALMISPCATALLLADHIHSLLKISIVTSIVTSLLGYTLAAHYDVSIAGAIATMSGICFLFVFVCAPQKGLIAHCVWQRKQRLQLLQSILCKYVLQYQRVSTAHAAADLGWTEPYLQKIVATLPHSSAITCENNTLYNKI